MLYNANEIPTSGGKDCYFYDYSSGLVLILHNHIIKWNDKVVTIQWNESGRSANMNHVGIRC